MLRCFYHPDYTFPLPEEHPFPMDKFWRAADTLRAASAAGAPLRVETSLEPAPLPVVARVHSAAYLDQLRAGALDHAAAIRLGLPASEALLTRSRLEAAGTLAATRAALADGLACNLAGGTHHAFADRGLGYCVLHDVVIALRDLHATTHPRLRVFVIDTDAHQGNGTAGLCADDHRVFTYSIHVGKNYPAEKTPGSLDVALPRWVGGEAYLDTLEATLAPAFADFAPDFAFWISGADPHEADRFGQMRLTDAHLAARDAHVLDLVTRHRVPTCVLYGGGYNRDRRHTAELHARTVLATAATLARTAAPGSAVAPGAAPAGTRPSPAAPSDV